MSKKENFNMHRFKVKPKKIGGNDPASVKVNYLMCTVMTKQRLHLSTIWTKPMVHCHLLENLKLPYIISLNTHNCIIQTGKMMCIEIAIAPAI